MPSSKTGVIVQKYKMRQLEILTDVQISPYVNAKSSRRAKSYKALWDTGSDLTSISQDIVKDFNLQAIHETPLITANGTMMSNIYAINVILPNGIKKLVRAVECNMDDDIDILLGMDIITQGDFAISADEQENMYFSYRTPSEGAILFE